MKIYITLFALLLFVSCSTSKSSINKTTSADISGTSWKGTIPCADCEGIAVQLAFHPDNTFQETYVYLGKSVSPFVDNGKWSVSKDGFITVTGSDGRKSYFNMAGNQLQMLNSYRKEAESPFKEMYLLNKMEGEESAAMYNDKMMSGIDFTASGNEPFWGLDIDFQTNISFQTADGFELNVPFVKTENPASGNNLTFFSKTAEGSIGLQVEFKKCMNSMSGAANPATVAVDVTDANGKATRYEGCGRFLGNYRLNNRWKLKSIGVDANDTMVIARAPEIQFNIQDGSVAGFSGCNRFHGGIEVTGDSIVFKQLASTLMACADAEMKLEDRFLKSITEKKLQFILTDNLLYLGDGANRLVFERED